MLYSKAAAKWASIDDYGCRMRRREVVQGRARPEEVIIAKFRKDPFSVHFEWVGQEGKGREMVYVQGQHGNLLHTLTAAGDVPLLPGGQRFKVSPDSMLVKAASRSSITDAGVGSLIERFGKLVADFERGDPRASAKYLGRMKRPEFENHVDVVVQKIPAGAEPTLPGGGQRLWCFDPGHGLPVLVVTHDHLDREVDFVCFDRFEFPGRYLDEVFHPDYLGKKLITGSR
ncbi:MAG: DUF1571 domain-containing protein [Gemmataceae bacterium]|nr:DUF1571 domain-containing protein [Gemmataceae bacterium]